MTARILAATDGLAAEALSEAVSAFRAGLVVGFPTDTVYGVGVDPSHPGATAGLYALKGRPLSTGLPVLVAGMDQLADLAGAVPGYARLLTDRFWPGGLTVVLRRRTGLDWDLGGDGATIGLRCPDHPVALALCRAVGPLATTSANRHGQPPAGSAAELAAALPGVAVVLNGGIGGASPSTVVDCTGPVPRVLRAGVVPADDVAAVAAVAGPVDSKP